MKNHRNFYNYHNMIVHELNFFKVYSKIAMVQKNQANVSANMTNILNNGYRIKQLEEDMDKLLTRNKMKTMDSLDNNCMDGNANPKQYVDHIQYDGNIIIQVQG